MRRYALLGALLVLAAAWWALGGSWGRVAIPVPVVRAVVLDPYDQPLLTSYKRYRDALLERDTAALAALADGEVSYAAYRAALTIAEQTDLEPALRARYYRRVLELRIDDPLDKLDKRALYLAYALVAEAAGEKDEALGAYEAALPEAAATAGLKRLQDDPYRLANTFLRHRRYRDALSALDGRSAPSIEAPAHRALGEYQEALEAYARWLAEVPGSDEARLGLAWSHYYLGEYDEADAGFAALSGASALYGRALVARRQGDTDRAVAFLRRTGDAEDLWLATGYLEAEDRYREALPIYLELAQGGSSYADDAAYRALVLAERLGDDERAAAARAAIPPDSFFALKLGERLELPEGRPLERPKLPVLERANALARVGDMDAAVGELLFALRETDDPNARFALAERLQLLGEFRQSQRVAVELLAQGYGERRLWELAYPQAYALDVGEAASRNGLEPALIWAIMRQESAFYPKAVSTSNAQGLMQVVPSTWAWLAELQREPPGNPFDVGTNVRYGSYYLRWLSNYLGGDLELVIASYNRGQGYIKRLFESSAVRGDKDELYREIDALETREYLQKVMVNYQVYRALYPELAARP